MSMPGSAELLIAGSFSTGAIAWSVPSAEGGMGSIWVGHQIALEREVAIKLLRVGSSAPLRARLRREALALAAVYHPAIVQVYDYGETPGGSPYLVMELVRGRDARRSACCARGRFRRRRRCSSWWCCSKGSRQRTARASSTATSSRTTSCSRPRPRASSQSSSISASRGSIADRRRASPRTGGSSARPRTWRRSRSAGRRRTSGRTCGGLRCCSTSSARVNRRSGSMT